MSTRTSSGLRASVIIVNPRQKGNRVLEHIRNVPYQFGPVSMPVDYEVGSSAGVLFLSMKYHKLHSNEIYTRIKEVGKRYSLLVLILLVDTANHWRVNREMTRLSVLTGFTVVLAWEDEEAARYIETLKAYEYKSPEAIRERTGDTPIDKLTAILTNIPSINKTDTQTLVATFPTVADILNADDATLKDCPGLGPKKIRSILDVIDATFNPAVFRTLKEI